MRIRISGGSDITIYSIINAIKTNQYIAIIMNNRCGVLFDERYFHHVISQASPENPRRIRSLYTAIEKAYKDRLQFIQPREADLSDITPVHSSFYLEQVWEHSLKEDPFSYDKDTYLMENSFSTALLAAGGCLELADRVIGGNLDYGFALIRPPGHHAEPGRGMGFCILNNIAITAEHLLKRHDIQRILVIDFDIHHGNGTQEIFYESDQVLVVSLHQEGLFPFTGKTDEVGSEQGEGFTVNVPIYSQFGDQEYTFLFGRLLQSLTEQFMPQVILVSAGFDGHEDDTISSTLLTTQWYSSVTTMLRQYAHEICDDRLIFILEGGYNPASLEASVLATLDSLLAPDQPRIGVLHNARAHVILQNHPLREYWTLA